MKRLILMGGRPWFAEDGGKNFVETLFRYYPEQVKLAFCIFAQPEEQWEETRAWNTRMFDKFKGNRTVSYQTMTKENFAEVSAWADVIYLPGGDSFALSEKLKPFDVGMLWDGKVIAGSSAGANLMCEGHISLDHKAYGQGLGWVKATSIPHWRSNYNNYTNEDWDLLEQKALSEAPGTPVLCIPESDFVEFTVA